MKTLTHPGERAIQRIQAVQGKSFSVHRELEPDQPLITQLTDTVAAHGATSGVAEIYSGGYQPASYCVPAIGVDGKAVSYSETRNTPTAQLIYGAATIGHRFGEPFIHSHCFWLDENQNQLGGHLWPETLVGNNGAYAIIHIFEGVDLLSADDPETHMPVFTPHPNERKISTMETLETHLTDTIVARVLPNEEIGDAIVASCREAGFDQATVRAGIGSLVGGAFINRITGEKTYVDGPGTEIIALIGHVKNALTEPEFTLSCTMVDRHGVIHAGELVPGENAVAVTFELVLQKLQ